MSQCRGKTKFEQFKKGLARNDVVKEIQKCDRQLSRMFERFTVRILILHLRTILSKFHQFAMLMDIRFQQVADKAQSTLTISMPIPEPQYEPRPLPLLIPQPQVYKSALGPTPRDTSTPIPSVVIEEPQPTLPIPFSLPQPEIYEPVAQTPSMRARSVSVGSSPVLFVPLTPLFFLCSDTLQAFPPPRSTTGLFWARRRAEDYH